jgi:LruC domain-containing protein
MSNTISGSKKVNGTLFTIFIEFNSPVSPSILGLPPYNSFISRELDNGEKLEVHFPGYFPSKQASKRKFGQFKNDSDSSQDRYYQTDNNLPWAMLIPSLWHHTKERVDLSNGYPDILNWASSKGKKT